MLFTDTSWKESHPFKKELVQPRQAWRCVAWSDLTLNFFVVARPGRGEVLSPDGWMVDGAQALVELILRLGAVDFTVHLMARNEADASIVLCRVTALWTEPPTEGATATHYWYSTENEPPRPCSPLASAADRKRPTLSKVVDFKGFNS